MFRILKCLAASLGALLLVSCGGGSGNVTDTVLVYMVGSNLESDGQAASTNIEQMLAVSRTSQLNIVLETGGADSQAGPLGIDWTHVQRYLVSNGKLQKLQDLGPDSGIDMGRGSTLRDFLRWGVSHYPANRYMLVLWDHGGGPNGGFGSDEVTGTTMTLGQLTQAVQGSGTQFSVIGFDACLMADAEVASALSPYAHYLVASQDVEPSEGWDYTPWLSSLQALPGASGATIGRDIVDAYMGQNLVDPTTLSVVDLHAMPALVQAMDSYASALQPYAARSVLAWQVLADARMRSLDFMGQNFVEPSTSPTDLVDELLWVGNTQSALLKSFGADAALSTAADGVIRATQAAVVYDRASYSDSQATGLSVYFPAMMANYPSIDYAGHLLIGGQSAFAPGYVNSLLPAYYDFYKAQQPQLTASVATQPVVGASFDATVTNSFDAVLVAAGSPSCTVYEAVSPAQQPCEETMQPATSYTHDPGTPTWQFSFDLSAQWPTLQGSAVALLPDPSVLRGQASLGYLIPAHLWNPNRQFFMSGYLRVVMNDSAGVDSYAVTGFQPTATPSGRIVGLERGDVVALDDFVQGSNGSWSFQRSARTVTLDSAEPQVSFAAYPLVAASPLTYLVSDLTGALDVGQTQVY
jgi:hypothetical protein